MFPVELDFHNMDWLCWIWQLKRWSLAWCSLGTVNRTARDSRLLGRSTYWGSRNLLLLAWKVTKSSPVGRSLAAHSNTALSSCSASARTLRISTVGVFGEDSRKQMVMSAFCNVYWENSSVSIWNSRDYRVTVQFFCCTIASCVRLVNMLTISKLVL